MIGLTDESGFPPAPRNPNQITDLEDFKKFINDNFMELTVAPEHSIQSDYEFLENNAMLDQDEIQSTLRWTAHNLYLGAAFGFPSTSTYFLNELGLERVSADLNSFHPIKAANIGNYIQHILLQLHNAYTSSDRLDRNSSDFFTKAVNQQLTIDPDFQKKLQYGYIKPKLGVIHVSGSGDIARINTARMEPRLNLPAVAANWNIVGAYQNADISPAYFANPEKNFTLLMDKIGLILKYANQGNTEGAIDVSYINLLAAATKINAAVAHQFSNY